MADSASAEVLASVGAASRAERHEALRALADKWWSPPEELVDTLPKGGVQLRYLSHIWVRKALQDADPDWWWEPMGYDSDGQPVIERDKEGNAVGLWIWLHVLGTRKAGYGSVEPGKRDAVKELIGDSLRNASMAMIGGQLWVKDKPDKPKRQTSKEREIQHLREQLDPPASGELHEQKAAGKDFYDRMVSEYGEKVVNDALATFNIAKFSELTPVKCEAMLASLKQRARLSKQQGNA